MTRLLAETDGPRVVLLEDLHWADQTSLRLLAYAAEELRARPVLLVATVRTVDPRPPPAPRRTPWPRWPGCRRGACRCRRWTTSRSPSLVSTVVDEPDADLVDVLTRRTDGNPFFVLEMARLLVATGDTTAGAAERLEVPDGHRRRAAAAAAAAR